MKSINISGGLASAFILVRVALFVTGLFILFASLFTGELFSTSAGVSMLLFSFLSLETSVRQPEYLIVVALLYLARLSKAIYDMTIGTGAENSLGLIAFEVCLMICAFSFVRVAFKQANLDHKEKSE